MIGLENRINARFYNLGTSHEGGNAEYTVYKSVPKNASLGGGYNWEPIFEGYVYIERRKSSVSICLNDIIEMNKRQPTILSVVPSGNLATKINDMSNAKTALANTGNCRYRVILTFNGTEYTFEDEIADYYLYPSHDYAQIGEKVDFYSNSIKKSIIREGMLPRVPMLPWRMESEGINMLDVRFGCLYHPSAEYLQSVVHQRVPFYIETKDGTILHTSYDGTDYPMTQYYTYIMSPEVFGDVPVLTDNVYFSTDVTNTKAIYFTKQLRVDYQEVDRDEYIQDFLMPICHMNNAEADAAWNKLMQGEYVVLFESEIKEERDVVFEEAKKWGSATSNIRYETNYVREPIAEIEICPSRYYLMWYDRLGGLQSQPFEQGAVYTESFERNHVKNQYGERKLGSVGVTQKWNIKSGWISESDYPYYESLLISPKVILIDTKAEEAYEVIVTDTDYKEKTHKNEDGQLLQFTVDVEGNKVQNMIF